MGFGKFIKQADLIVEQPSSRLHFGGPGPLWAHFWPTAGRQVAPKRPPESPREIQNAQNVLKSCPSVCPKKYQKRAFSNLAEL